MYTTVLQIGDKSMAPKETEHSGKAFRRCGAWENDPYGEISKDKDGNEMKTKRGKPLRKRKDYQLIFSNTETGRKQFQQLRPGMKILVTGNLSDKPKVVEVGDSISTKKDITVDAVSGKKYIAYSNLRINVFRIEFLDPPKNFMLDAYKKMAIEEGISEEEAAKFVELVSTHLDKSDVAAAPGSDVPPQEGSDENDDPF